MLDPLPRTVCVWDAAMVNRSVRRLMHQQCRVNVKCAIRILREFQTCEIHYARSKPLIVFTSPEVQLLVNDIANMLAHSVEASPINALHERQSVNRVTQKVFC